MEQEEKRGHTYIDSLDISGVRYINQKEMINLLKLPKSSDEFYSFREPFLPSIRKIGFDVFIPEVTFDEMLRTWPIFIQGIEKKKRGRKPTIPGQAGSSEKHESSLGSGIIESLQNLHKKVDKLFDVWGVEKDQ